MKQREELSLFYDDGTGLPKDKSYLECGLPEFLLESIQAMKINFFDLCPGPSGTFFGFQMD